MINVSDSREPWAALECDPRNATSSSPSILSSSFSISTELPTRNRGFLKSPFGPGHFPTGKIGHEPVGHPAAKKESKGDDSGEKPNRLYQRNHPLKVGR